ncbi:telomerase inhibitor [Didymosphaeria variabile]|uniref:PinX1-related protein 1 n=1 Tax=Didymosphaeria variabile TaxID=1932322 RepID=A0A9W8X9A1_9PLEO|nr:telomerase inhibitor [Didymosphaeria variabile]KAJ4344541.1 telomerase inhibitor [Didymosphaeria variabile]
MGLAAPKNRSKISNDPQNTTWANNTERFGHRILTSQGWTPGSSLGATDAAHKAHYTAASHSHIRVLLKDDNLGLGAKRGSERAENFGLAGFASILGRLNGKEEEVKKEQERQEKIAQRAYVYQKFGMMNFVSGGFLVGDKIEKGVKREIEVKVEVKSEPESSDSEAVEKKSKKRKRSSEDEVKLEEQSGDEPELKRKKKSMNLREEAAKEDAALKSSSKSKKEKKDKKDKKDKKSKSASDTLATDSEPLSDKARRKAEKRARKEEKKLKKALKKAAKEAAKSSPTTEDPSSGSEEEVESTSASSVPTSGTATPSGLTYNPRGMHAVRQRYIRQKKMASMDPQALKEV